MDKEGLEDGSREGACEILGTELGTMDTDGTCEGCAEVDGEILGSILTDGRDEGT